MNGENGVNRTRELAGNESFQLHLGQLKHQNTKKETFEKTGKYESMNPCGYKLQDSNK